MKQGPNDTPEAGCLGKHRYPSFAAAKEVADRYRQKRKSPHRGYEKRRGDEPIEAYRCRYCTGYHVGRPRNAPRVVNRRRKVIKDRLRIEYADR